ncbi:MAG: hypothetical protein WC091_15365 [Sulfuricellaceae bacterium]
MKLLVQCLEDLIDDDWKLERSSNRWLVKELGDKATHNLLEITGGKSIAFSLDKSGNKAFPFMCANTPLGGMHSVCDAIVIALLNGMPFVVMIEMKSTKKGDAGKQLQRSRVFMDWIVELLRINGHCSAKPKACGVISFKPRQQERKGTTTHASMPEPGLVDGLPVFQLKNHPRINLVDLVDALKKAA